MRLARTGAASCLGGSAPGAAISEAWFASFVAFALGCSAGIILVIYYREQRSSPMDEVDDREENDDEIDDDGIPDAIRRRLETFVPELVRKTFAAGMGAVFTTEEGIRKITKDMPLPKELASYVASTAGAGKDEVMRVMAREVREFLQTVNFSEEIAKMLTMLSFEVKTEIRFIPNDEKFGGVEPDVKAKVRIKKTGEEDEEDEEEAAASEERPKGRRRRLTKRGREADEPETTE